MEYETVYILLTRSGTWFSQLIHFATQDRYTHASIGLDGPTGPFYSFARKYDHLALPAGLVEERITPRRWAIPCCLYELSVHPYVYRRLRLQLDGMYQHREDYHYNLLGTLGCFLHRPLSRRNHYFCSQFVATLLQECGAADLPKPPTLLRPSDLSSLHGLRAIHQGELEGILLQVAG
ncbi:MAG: hypothetical protein ACOX7N_07120 [Lawsonibacter sp.]